MAVVTKTDLKGGLDPNDLGLDALLVSAKTGDGLPQLLSHLEEAAVGDLMDSSGMSSPLTRVRHRTALAGSVWMPWPVHRLPANRNSPQRICALPPGQLDV